MNPTAVHSSEVVGQLVLIEANPIRQRLRHAIAGFLAGYSGTTLEAYRLDLRGWIGWLDTAFLDPLAVAVSIVSPTTSAASAGVAVRRSAWPDSVSNFSHDCARAENLHTLKHAYRRASVVLAPAPDRPVRAR